VLVVVIISSFPERAEKDTVEGNPSFFLYNIFFPVVILLIRRFPFIVSLGILRPNRLASLKIKGFESALRIRSNVPGKCFASGKAYLKSFINWSTVERYSPGYGYFDILFEYKVSSRGYVANHKPSGLITSPSNNKSISPFF
jgi:hypothetical protein